MRIDVLDHGYVELIECWGQGRYPGEETKPDGPIWLTDTDYEVGIIEAARQSTQGSFRGWDPAACDCGIVGRPGKHVSDCSALKNPGDKKLLAFLYNNKHSTPFEFAGMTLEIMAPIAVFREWQRHRTQSYSEASARYAPLDNFNYIPSIDRLMQVNEGSANKQAGALRDAPELTTEVAESFQWVLKGAYERAEKCYQEALAHGVSKELARLVMPVGRYSKMRASANLRNWLAFLTLRLDPAAQYEIRVYAYAVATIIEKTFPRTFELFAEEARRKG